MATGSPKANNQIERVNCALSALSDHDCWNMWPKLINEIEFAKEFLELEINIKARYLDELQTQASQKIEKNKNSNKIYAGKKRKEVY